jgi:hypothetical protein
LTSTATTLTSTYFKEKTIFILDFDDTGSSDDEMDSTARTIQSIIHTDYLGADPEELDSSEDSDGDTTDEGEEDDPPAAIAEVAQQETGADMRQQQSYQVGDFVTAMYDGEWLLAQVDINQDMAGDTHVNLNYMECVGYNQFRWPKNMDLLLTLKEDILTKCSTPIMVGSSIRALHVGLTPREALEASAALNAVVYLQSILFHNFFHSKYILDLIHFLNLGDLDRQIKTVPVMLKNKSFGFT